MLEIICGCERGLEIICVCERGLEIICGCERGLEIIGIEPRIMNAVPWLKVLSEMNE